MLQQQNVWRAHDDVIKWKHFPRRWPVLRGIHRPLVNSPHKGQWREALTFSLISTWTKSCKNNRDAGDLRRHRTHYDVTVTSKLTNADNIFAKISHANLMHNLDITYLEPYMWCKNDKNTNIHLYLKLVIIFDVIPSCHAVKFDHFRIRWDVSSYDFVLKPSNAVF